MAARIWNKLNQDPRGSMNAPNWSSPRIRSSKPTKFKGSASIPKWSSTQIKFRTNHLYQESRLGLQIKSKVGKFEQRNICNHRVISEIVIKDATTRKRDCSPFQFRKSWLELNEKVRILMKWTFLPKLMTHIRVN